jgi:acetyl-CoA carboxylase alpha subunit
MNTPPILPLEQLKAVVGFTPFGDVVGNLTLGRGQVNGQALHVALVENKIASGSFGLMECNKLAQLLRLVAKDTKPLVLFLDSAGARVSQGLQALGAFRNLFRAAMELAASNAPVVTVLGANCYGGASMLAHLGRVRIFAENTQLAMSGPAILAQAAGSNALDEMFRAIAQVSISAEARAKVAPSNQVMGDLSAQIAAAIQLPALSASSRHAMLEERLGTVRESIKPPTDALKRKDLEKLFAGQYELFERDGFVSGTATLNDVRYQVLGLIGGKTVGVAKAWAMADAVWQSSQNADPLLVLLDAESHSTRIDDEKIVLSEYLFGLAQALHARTVSKLIVLGKSGGGSFVAFSAADAPLALVRGAVIQVLPGAAMASILGDSTEAEIEFAEYKKAGVAEEELKLGLVPGLIK